MALKVLIVEDNMIIQMFIESIIEGIDNNIVRTASNSNEAMSALRFFSPDIILLDIGLSGDKDGIEVAEVINKDYQIPFVFITGNSDASTIERANKTNPMHIIRKPIDENQLKAEFEIICGKLVEKL
ncbi:MAG: response regulator [Cellulophaga sp.]|uniref:response regulator n=2 Tax=Cellulophaga TaxID=104264 RepID=UPI000C2CC8CB|nr:MULTISPECIES: response regulator [unclassified Cellulophaga]MDO6490959.1 response regulator [Cellulophaga sp. 2_MG-2023]MDO6493847.1 response regulator [Cellulophaga sp. 3_MG-2023]PKB44145.1 response regulator receiver domain-containing protein [Cellulophaga sp. RHA19]